MFSLAMENNNTRGQDTVKVSDGAKGGFTEKQSMSWEWKDEYKFVSKVVER